MKPALSGDFVTTCHPGQVSQSGTRAGIQEKVATWKSDWIPDLAAFGGLVRNDGFGEL